MTKSYCLVYLYEILADSMNLKMFNKTIDLNIEKSDKLKNSSSRVQ